ncbi:MAG TPA: shikimate kinase, partial [Candidatus Binatia bacterium]|nr:shikimate kinase [Candidatus Binatia bacterium]
DLDSRLERNQSEFRLSKKPSKRDVERSEAGLLDTEQRYKMNSTDDFFYTENYIKINNSHLMPEKTARQIVDAFGFTVTQSR